MKNAKELKQSFIQIHTEKLAKQARQINMSIDWEDTSHWNCFNISLISLRQQEETEKKLRLLVRGIRKDWLKLTLHIYLFNSKPYGLFLWQAVLTFIHSQDMNSWYQQISFTS